MMIEEGLSIKTTMRCQRRCKNCTVVPLMDAYPDYEMCMSDLTSLIEMSTKNNIQWKYILLSGGEPLLWDRVVNGARYLYHSRITNDLKLLTNAMAVSEDTLGVIEELLSIVDHFRVSRYNNNGAQIDLLRKHFGSRIEVEDRSVHIIPPIEPVKDSLPADCRCKAYSMFNGFIDSCGPARTIHAWIDRPLRGYMYGQPPFLCRIYDFKKYFVDVPLDRYSLNACQYCIANAKVQKYLKKEEA